MSSVSKQKDKARARAKFRIRKRISNNPDKARLSVFRSSKHIYAQIISDATGKTIAYASSQDGEVKGIVETLALEASNAVAAGGTQENDGAAVKARDVSKSSKSVLTARAVGRLVAQRSKDHQVEAVVFDRNGFQYTGRVQAVAEGAREGGLQF